jgi:hypothetical protein
MGPAQVPGDPDAFVVHRGRHADVGHDHIGLVHLDRVAQFDGIDADGDDLEVLLVVQELCEGLTDEEAVLGECHPDGHPTRVASSRRHDKGAHPCVDWVLTAAACAPVPSTDACILAGGRPEDRR